MQRLENRKEKSTQGINNPRLLSLKAASEYSGLTLWCLRSLVWGGKIPFVRFGEKKLYLDRVDLDRLIDSKKEVFGA
jgi:hypothetical protein